MTDKEVNEKEESEQEASEQAQSDQLALSCDIAIVGGGMVGLTLALMLSKVVCAERIVLVEPTDIINHKDGLSSPSFDARSTALSAGTIDVLEQLQLWPALADIACAISTVKVSDKGHIGYTQYDSTDNAGQGLGAVIENHYLGAALLQRAQNDSAIEIVTKTKALAIRPKVGGMQLTLERAAKQSSLNTKLVVLADGALSPLAKTLGIEFSEHSYSQHAVIANVEHSDEHKGSAFECFYEKGPLAMLPLPDFNGKHRSALVWTISSEEVEALMCSDEAQFIERLQTQFGFRLGHIRSVGKRNSYPLNLYFAKEQVRSSLVLMGNAAHFLHPVAGQGFNLAIRDCVELCSQLSMKHHSLQSQKPAQIRQLGDLATLQAYASARAKDQWLTTELSHNFIRLFASGHPSKQLLRGAGLLALNKMPKIKSLFFQQMMGRAGKGAAFT